MKQKYPDERRGKRDDEVRGRTAQRRKSEVAKQQLGTSRSARDDSGLQDPPPRAMVRNPRATLRQHAIALAASGQAGKRASKAAGYMHDPRLR